MKTFKKMRISLRSCCTFFFILTAFLTVQLGYSQTASRPEKGETISNVHKCVCDASEALVDGQCIEQKITYNFMISTLHRTTKKLRSSKIDNVTISNISCPPEYFQVSLPGNEFAFLGNGNLVHFVSDLTVPVSEYCLEHHIDEIGEIYDEVKFCLKVPKIRTCCQSHSSSCNSTIKRNMALPTWIGDNVQEIPVVGTEAILVCEQDTNMTHSLLFQESPIGAKLMYTGEGLILSFSNPHKSEVEFFESMEYCITSDPMGSLPPQATFCYKDKSIIFNQTCKEMICISKCCSEGMLFSMDEFSCVAVEEAEIWKPVFYDSFTQLERETSSLNASSYHMLHGYPICGNGSFILDPEDVSNTVIKLFDDGNLYEERTQSTWEPLNYCVDNFKSNNRIVEKALVCFKVYENLEEECAATSIIYPLLLLLSALCLLLTLAVYFFVPELSAKIQGKSLISSISALFVAYMCLVVVQFSHDQLSSTGCSVIALFIQYFSLASFFWLNVMSYDIWRTFRCMKIRKESPTSSKRRFLLYSSYAWGCPLIIVVVTAVMQFIPDQENEEYLVRPKFTETQCFFTNYDQRASWAYFHGFITVILVANCFFFIHLAWILVKAQKVSENALGRRNQHYTEWAKLYLKLFVVMGVTWIFEVIAYVEGSCSLWIVTDIINTLRGVFIFVIFVCKHDTLKKIRTRGSPALSSIRSTFNTSSSFFSRSSKRTSSLYNNEPTTSSKSFRKAHNTTLRNTARDDTTWQQLF